MARKRLSMRKTREIPRQKWALGRSHREVRDAARSTSGSTGRRCAPSRDALCLRGVEAGEGEPRLSRGAEAPLLLGASRARAQGGGAALHGVDGGGVQEGTTGGVACALRREGSAHDRARAHAQGASGAPEVDAHEAHSLGVDRGPADRGAGRTHPLVAPPPEQGHRTCLGILRRRRSTVRAGSRSPLIVPS